MPEELAEEARSVELDKSVKDMLEEVSILVGSSELVEELVGELDVVALALEGPVFDTLSVVVEMEVTAGELKDELAEDDTPLSVELEVNEVTEDGLELSEDIEDGLGEMLKELVTIEDWLSAELAEGSNVLDEVLKIEVLGSAEFDEPLSELEVDTDADEEVLAAVELIEDEVGLTLDISELNIELVLDTTELGLPVIVELIVIEMTELKLLGEEEVLILDIAEFELLVAGVELDVILDIMELGLPIIVELIVLEMTELEMLDEGGELLDGGEEELLDGGEELLD